MRANPSDAFYYVYSCDLQSNLQIKISEFEGNFRDPQQPTRRLSQLFAEITVYCNDIQIGYPVSTSYRTPPEGPQLAQHRLIHSWNEWLTLPVRYCDLSRDAFVHIAVYELDFDMMQDDPTMTFPKKLVAQSRMSLFSKRGILKSGTIDVQMSLGEKLAPFQKVPPTWKYSDGWDDNIDVLFKQVKRQSRGLVEDVPWLNPFTSTKIENIRAKQKYASVDRNLFMVVEVASVRFGTTIYEVVYYEEEKNIQLSTSLGGVTMPFAKICVADPELGFESLAEVKHSLMTRMNRHGSGDIQLKPNKQWKERLEAIIKLPSSQGLTREQRDLVWKFRFYLREDPRALNKFLRSVNWELSQEEQAALALMKDWAPIQAEDALELLSPTFTHPEVRSYAVSRLIVAASPEQVQLYLPQLVQALKYEPVMQFDTSFLVGQPSDSDDVVSSSSKSHEDLATFLIEYALTSSKLSNFLFWYLKVEIEATRNTDENVCKMYTNLLEKLFTALKSRPDTMPIYESLNAQIAFVNDLKSLTSEAKMKGGRIDSKEVALRTLLSKAKSMNDMKGVSLPLDPSVKLSSVIADTAHIFNSQLMPVKLTFKVMPPAAGERADSNYSDEYTFIFKQGDDLRQDQLIIQMIRLMDSLFKKDQLDLRLTPYAVLATGVDEGFVQFVKARALRVVMNNTNSQLKVDSIREAMKELRPDANGPMGIEGDVIDNYVRSLAGYTIISYVLGIGDRHLDNLLLCENGKLFHVDFGYILGRDPKPMPPPMKLTNEMVNAMGGLKSDHFMKFFQYCDAAYRILRRHANVLLNLFSLMLDAGIPDIASEPDKAVFKIEQRLRLELSDEQATKHIFHQIDESLSAKMPLISDLIHQFRINYL